MIAAPETRLAEVKGLGGAGITELKIVQAAASRLLRGALKKRPVLSSWSNVLDYCRSAQGPPVPAVQIDSVASSAQASSPRSEELSNHPKVFVS